MRDEAVIRERLGLVVKRGLTLLSYREECIRIGDHHGVQDASSDLREIEAAERTLSWVLGELDSLAY